MKLFNIPLVKLIPEALRHSTSRPLFTVLSVLFGLVVGSALALIGVRTSDEATNRHETLTANGWGLIMVMDASGQEVSEQVCNTAEKVPGVTNVALIGKPVHHNALGLSAGLSVVEVSTQTPKFIWPGTVSTHAPAYVTPGLTTLTGLRSGEIYLDYDGTFLPQEVAVLAEPGRMPALDGNLLSIVTLPSTIEYCLVEVATNQIDDSALDIAQATVSYNSIAVPVISNANAHPTPSAIIAAYRAQNFPLIAAGSLTIFSAIRAFRAKRDRSVYRLLMFSRGDLFLMGALDFLTCLAVPAIIGFISIISWAEFHHIKTQIVGSGDYAQFALSTTIAMFGYAAVWASGKNRHQFAPGS